MDVWPRCLCVGVEEHRRVVRNNNQERGGAWGTRPAQSGKSPLSLDSYLSGMSPVYPANATRTMVFVDQFLDIHSGEEDLAGVKGKPLAGQEALHMQCTVIFDFRNSSSKST
jgi:hypothetical protein